jgi:molecular chaperone GrpE
MTTESQRSELLEDFQNFLEQSNLDPLATSEQPDLNTLLSEMTGLKTEVKAESRQYKNTLDTLSSALTSVQNANETLEKQQHEIMQTVFLDIIDVYDRLTAGVDILQKYRPVASLFKRSRVKDIGFIKRFKEGQIMTVRRYEQLFQRYQIQAIDCVGKLLDPTSMNAIETGQNPNLENGIVLEEIRKGFLFQDQVLRLAEVKVNKINARELVL